MTISSVLPNGWCPIVRSAPCWLGRGPLTPSASLIASAPIRM